MIIGFLHERKTCFCTYIYIYVSKWHFFWVEKPMWKITPDFYIYICKNASGWLKIICSAEDSKNHQNAFWHIYICKNQVLFFTWVLNSEGGIKTYVFSVYMSFFEHHLFPKFRNRCEIHCQQWPQNACPLAFWTTSISKNELM